MLLVISIFITRQMVSIPINDTNYSIRYSQAFLISGAILFLLGILYKLTEQRLLSNILTWANIILTALALLTILTLPIWTDKNQRRYLDFSAWTSFNKSVYNSYIISWALTIFKIAQLLLLGNLLITLIYKFRKGRLT